MDGILLGLRSPLQMGMLRFFRCYLIFHIYLCCASALREWVCASTSWLWRIFISRTPNGFCSLPQKWNYTHGTFVRVIAVIAAHRGFYYIWIWHDSWPLMERLHGKSALNAAQRYHDNNSAVLEAPDRECVHVICHQNRCLCCPSHSCTTRRLVTTVWHI